MTFEEREKQFFALLKEAKDKVDFVVIGGYAINAYALPRFSVDCDVVVKNKKDLGKFQVFLEKNSFKMRSKGPTEDYSGTYLSMVSKNPPKLSFDILAGSVEDRLTKTIFFAEEIFLHSSKRTIFGKGSPIKMETRVVDAEFLFLMKAITARTTDIRDVFMLSLAKLDKKKLVQISKKFPVPSQSIKKISSTIQSEEFKNSLQGVFGKIQQEQFARTLKAALSLIKKLKTK